MNPGVVVTVQTGAADPAQLTAWRLLWVRLLSGKVPSRRPAAESGKRTPRVPTTRGLG